MGTVTTPRQRILVQKPIMWITLWITLPKKEKAINQRSLLLQKKEEEYPKIDWENLDDADVQMATVLYNDRINTYRKMKQLDELLEKERNAQAVADMAELRIRNLQAFAELQSFNDTGKFLCKHPLLFGRSEIAELMKLLKADPAEFLRQHKNVLDNIKRYRSYIKRTDRKNRRTDDLKNLERHREREKLFKMVLEQQNK